MKGEKYTNQAKTALNEKQFPSYKLIKTANSKVSTNSIKTENSQSRNQYNSNTQSSLINKRSENKKLTSMSINNFTVSKICIPNKHRNNKTFNLEVSTSNIPINTIENVSNINTNSYANTRIKDFLNFGISKLQKISPLRNNIKTNDSQLKSCLESYIKDSKKMRNFSDSKTIFKSFSKDQRMTVVQNNSSNYHHFTSFNERKNYVSTKNSISSLNNSLNDKMKKNFNSNISSGLGNLINTTQKHNKTNSVMIKNSEILKLRNTANTDLKRNLSYLCDSKIKYLHRFKF